MNEAFRKFALATSNITGSPWAFLAAVTSILAWALSGSSMQYSDSWMLIINTGTTIVTYLLVFIIQGSQNRDSKAIQVKLNAILAAQEGASNKLIDLENQAESELEEAVEEIKQHRYDRD